MVPKKEEFSEFELEALRVHNECRARHGCPALKLNKAISTMSQKFAEKLASTRDFEHSRGKDRQYKGQNMGENLAMAGGTGAGADLSGERATMMWYDEIEEYVFSKPKYSHQTGHFSQVVWKSTKEMGIGFASYEDGQYTTTIVVANYFPAGNWMGQEAQNVPRPKY